ncbi:MAG TPA: type II toxin-antitoxin system antitoxin SocA domain-containing protein [Stellaceae bacterium]|nr:type II toxin-antitoxin system antitoxin SocA domain-containing protein [Stellaceae bacterium]
MLTASCVAEWMVRYRSDDLGVPVDPMQLQKLLVYAQSFYLALYGEALFSDEVVAWRDGMVVERVWQSCKDFGNQPIVAPDGQDADAALLGAEIEAFLIEVISFFGGYTAIKLSDAVHAEDPWRNARAGIPRRAPSNTRVGKETLRTYYRALIDDGEAALSRHELLATVPDPRWGYFYVAGICDRRMYSHPFFDRVLAQQLMRPIPREDELPASAYEPIAEGDYVELGDVSGLTSEEIVRRARDASRAA